MAADPPQPTNLTSSLGLAIVASSSAPLLLLDGGLTVIAASASFCAAFKIKPETIAGFKLFELGRGEWERPQLRALLEATARGFANVENYEMDLIRPNEDARRVVLGAQRLEYADAQDVRILLTAADVTDVRRAEKVKDDLLREQTVLMHEMQHRVANSLQIIASVLLQSAKKMPSEETRSHLENAHQRVMSVASMQRQLAETGMAEVALRPYLTSLCGSIGASMIRDHKLVSIDVLTDDSVTSSEVSISLGLIVTELVINALKHAFPENRKGQILVDYQRHRSTWTLSVADNGIGILNAPAASRPGLGTSIIEALANQLHAVIDVTSADPGTIVCITHGRAPVLTVATSQGSSV